MGFEGYSSSQMVLIIILKKNRNILNIVGKKSFLFLADSMLHSGWNHFTHVKKLYSNYILGACKHAFLSDSFL